MTPLSLRYFVAVCEEGNIARAADQESLVASALSKRIASLEAEIGVTLLVRRRRGVEPPPAGQALWARAREVLGGLDRLLVELRGFADGVQGSVRVAASLSVLAEHLARRHRALRRPSIRGSKSVSTIDLTGLDASAYRRDRLCVAINPSHPLARRPSLRFAEILDHPSINLDPDGQLDQLLRRQAALLGRLPQHRVQVSTLDAACRIVGVGLGLVVLPLEAAAPHAGAGRLSLVPLEEPWALRQFVIVTRPAPLVSVAAGKLIETLKHLSVLTRWANVEQTVFMTMLGLGSWG